MTGGVLTRELLALPLGAQAQLLCLVLEHRGISPFVLIVVNAAPSVHSLCQHLHPEAKALTQCASAGLGHHLLCAWSNSQAHRRTER